jgi:hypothetical protein
MFKLRSAQISAFERDQYEPFIGLVTIFFRSQFSGVTTLALPLKHAEDYGLKQAANSPIAMPLREDI